jgi:hypothetical protein
MCDLTDQINQRARENYLRIQNENKTTRDNRLLPKLRRVDDEISQGDLDDNANAGHKPESD